MKFRLKPLLFAVLLSVSSLIVLPSGDASAVSGTCYFNTTAGPVGSTSGCAETGLGDYGTNDVLTGRSSSGNGSAIPLSVNSKSEFVNYILNRFNNGSDHNRIGAAFIMQEMRNSRAWPGSTQRDDWKARMNADDVTVKSEWDSKVGRTSWYDDDKKNVFYDDHPNVGRQVINIRQDGKLIAQIEHLCGNLVAGAIELKDPWDIDPNTAPIPATVSPGDIIKWTHTVTNKGPGTTTRDGSFAINASPSGTSIGSSENFNSGKAKGWVVTRNTSYTVKESDIGKTLCQSIRVSPDSSSNFGAETGPNRCTKVIAGYDLTPNVDLTEGVVDPGSAITVTGTVDKGGSNSSPTQWELSKIVVAPNGTINGAADNTTTPSGWYANDWESVGSGTTTFTNQTTVVANLANFTIPDLPVGTRVCFALSIKPPSSDVPVTTWRHSMPKCVTIGKKPKVQVLGNDLRVRGEIRTSTSVVNVGGNKLFGSWTEFGVMSTDNNNAMASGAALRLGNNSTTQAGWSGLTFANTKPAGADGDVYGNLDDLPTPAAIADYFDSQGTTVPGGSFSLDGKASGIYRLASDTTVSGSTTNSIIIVSDGTVRLVGSGTNYAKSTGITSLDQIPQVVIVAKDITIADSVSKVDGWLIASNSINTCASVTNVDSPALTSDSCNTPLTINGAVATKSLYLFRTAGSGTGAATRDPAEIFNLRPDSYLWAYHYGLQLSRPTTASVVELPPRF